MESADDVGPSEGIDQHLLVPQREIVGVNRRHCPHCDRSVSIKTYKAHKRLYFQSLTGDWSTCTMESATMPQGTMTGDEESDSPPISLGRASPISNDDLQLSFGSFMTSEVGPEGRC